MKGQKTIMKLNVFNHKKTELDKLTSTYDVKLDASASQLQNTAKIATTLMPSVSYLYQTQEHNGLTLSLLPPKQKRSMIISQALPPMYQPSPSMISKHLRILPTIGGKTKKILVQKSQHNFSNT